MHNMKSHILSLSVAIAAFVLAVAPPAYARGVLCLTFDDSHFDDWEAVMPLFEKYNARATFFARGELPPRHVAGMRRLSEAGHSIGLHGRLHVRAPIYLGEHGADAWLRDEVLPQIDICRSAGLPIRNFAYPYNARTDETDGILQGQGFARLRSGLYARPGDVGELDGAFFAGEAGECLEMRALGLGKSYGRGAAELLALLPRVAESNLVLSTFSHRICDNPPDNGISPQTLEKILSGAAALGIAVVGFDDLPAAEPTPFSMTFKATACLGEISTQKGRERVFAKLRALGVSAVWLEGFRLGQSVPDELLREERDAFRAAGFDVRGCIHPTMLNRYTEEQKKTLSRVRIVKPCFNDPDAMNRMRDEFLKLARLFDEVIIDDSFNTFCGDECPRCKAAREAEGYKDASAYYCSLVERIGRDFVVRPTREVNPKFRMFFKFPDWYHMWRTRGMDALRIVEIFGDCWIGNETRDWHPEPLQACWYVQRANRIFGERCGGTWFDPLDSEPEKFVEQARYALLGGARELLFHAWDYLFAEDPGQVPFGQDMSRGRVGGLAFEREARGLHELAAILAGAEQGPVDMFAGVSRHEFRRGGRLMIAWQNTTGKETVVHMPHGSRLALALPDASAVTAGGGGELRISPHGFALSIRGGHPCVE